MLVTLFSLQVTHISYAQERIAGWGDFYFGMKKKNVEKILNRLCVEVEKDYSLVGEGCSVSDFPFSNLKTSITLDFEQAFFFDGNSTLNSIYFSVEDDNKAVLEKFYNYATGKWVLSEDWNCDSPIISSVFKTSSQSCNVKFNKGRIKVSGHTLKVDKNSTWVTPGASSCCNQFFAV